MVPSSQAPLPERYARPLSVLVTRVFMDEVQQQVRQWPTIGVIHHRRRREVVSAGASLDDYRVLTYPVHGYAPALFRSAGEAGDEDGRGDQAERGELKQKLSSQRV